MTGFPRNVAAALDREYDVIVAGGGIHGMMLTLEAARRGLRPLLVERGDFGGAASLSSLRILHGGLRYLQHLDLPRFFESVAQRGWYLRHFAPFCRILPCLLPLHGRGLKRPSVFRAALGLNDLLSRAWPLPKGRVLTAEETIRLFPHVPRAGLQGGALWHDGQVLSPQRLHAELLRWAVARGATVLNYVEAVALERHGSRVAGLVTNAGTFKAPVVINAAGAWCRELATRLDRDQPSLMTPTLTYNLLVDVPPPSQAAVAVQGARLYFVTPHRSGRTFVGTVHRLWEGLNEPTEAMIDEFLSDLQQALPGWPVSRDSVVQVAAGVLPGQCSKLPDMAQRPAFVVHPIIGLYSVCGIKYTTAQRFAVKVLQRIFGKRPVDESTPQWQGRESWVEPEAVATLSDDALDTMIREEAVTCAEDLVHRRIDWIPDPAQENALTARITRKIAHQSAT